jgi:hypothetical protein
MTGRIVGCALDNGWVVRSPLEPDERGGSVMLTLPQGVDPVKTVSALRSERLYCDARGATLRLSPGMVTSDDAVGALLQRLQQLIGARQRRAS